MSVKELHRKHNDHQTLKKEKDEMRGREADLVKRIGDLKIKNNTIEENIHYLHEKLIGCMKT